MPLKNVLTTQEQYTLFVLVYVNVLNYMDRYTVAGILSDLQEEFKIGDEYGGLLQTAFLAAYTIFAPISGYFGDRYSRRIIMTLSILLWTTATFIGSFAKTYGFFFSCRVFVGIGEAAYSSIAPTVIYDVTYKDVRKAALAVFNIAIPIGAGLGYVVGSKTASLAGHWSWGMRVTPIMAIVGATLMCFSKDPIRGERERIETGNQLISKITNYKNDLRSLSRNRSFLLSTFGFTTVAFVIGALSWWAPKFLHSGFRLIPGSMDMAQDDIALAFGSITVVAGLIGVPLGAYISYLLVPRYPAVDPIICAFALIVSDPLILAALAYADQSIPITIVTVFFGQIFMNLTWTIVIDILLSTVVPESRSTAESLQIAISHALGDAGSPYFVGLLSEILKAKWKREQSPIDKDTELIHQFQSMQYGMFSTGVVQFLGGMLFLANAFFIVADKEAVVQALASASASES